MLVIQEIGNNKLVSAKIDELAKTSVISTKSKKLQGVNSPQSRIQHRELNLSALESKQCSKACDHNHIAENSNRATIGLEVHRNVPISSTQIVPFQVPHIPSRLLYGRMRK